MGTKTLGRWLRGRENTKLNETQNLTRDMAVIIFVPPEAPTTKRGTPSLSRNMVGDIEDMGRLKGSIKLLLDGSTPKAFFVPGVEKSSISLL